MIDIDTEKRRKAKKSSVLKLQKQAETAKEKIKGDLAETAYTLTSDIVEKLSGLEIKDKDIQKAVMSYMDDTSTAKKQKKAA